MKTLIAFSDYQKLHLEIQEMWCPSCAQVISLVLLKEKGISRCMVDYVTDLAVIEFTPKVISNEKIEVFEDFWLGTPKPPPSLRADLENSRGFSSPNRTDRIAKSAQ